MIATISETCTIQVLPTRDCAYMVFFHKTVILEPYIMAATEIAIPFIRNMDKLGNHREGDCCENLCGCFGIHIHIHINVNHLHLINLWHMQ